MDGLDHAALVRLGHAEQLQGRAFTLHLGPWEIAGVPFSTVATLHDDPEMVRALLGSCCAEEEILTGDLAAIDRDRCRRALEELGAILAAEGQRLDAAPESRAQVLREIVCRWREATADAADGLGESIERLGRGPRQKRALQIVSEYRRKVYGAASALVQLLPADDREAARARRILDRLRESLAAATGASAREVREAAWYPADAPEDDGEPAEAGVGSVTWGIP
jgi:hypothetical protein